MKKRLLALTLVLSLCLGLTPAMAAEEQITLPEPYQSVIDRASGYLWEETENTEPGRTQRILHEETISRAGIYALAFYLYDAAQGGDGTLLQAPEDWGYITMTVDGRTIEGYAGYGEDGQLLWGWDAWNRSESFLCLSLRTPELEEWGKAHNNADAMVTLNGETYEGVVACWMPTDHYILRFMPVVDTWEQRGEITGTLHHAVYREPGGSWWRDIVYTIQHKGWDQVIDPHINNFCDDTDGYRTAVQLFAAVTDVTEAEYEALLGDASYPLTKAQAAKLVAYALDPDRETTGAGLYEGTTLTADAGKYHFQTVFTDEKRYDLFDVYLMDREGNDTGVILPDLRDKAQGAEMIVLSELFAQQINATDFLVGIRDPQGEDVRIDYPVSSLDWCLDNLRVNLPEPVDQTSNGRGITLGQHVTQLRNDYYGNKRQTSIVRNDGSGWKRLLDVPWSPCSTLLPYNGKTFWVADYETGLLYVSEEGLDWQKVDALRPADLEKTTTYTAFEYQIIPADAGYLARLWARETPHWTGERDEGDWYAGATQVFFLDEDFRLTGSHDFGRLVRDIAWKDGVCSALVSDSVERDEDFDEATPSTRYWSSDGGLTWSTDAPAFEPVGTTSFTDVPADAWYTSSVDYCAAEGIMIGTGEGRFEPDKLLTQAECMTLAYRIYDILREGDGAFLTAPEGWDLTAVARDGWWRDVAYTIREKGLTNTFELYQLSSQNADRAFFARYLYKGADKLEKINWIDFIPDLAPNDVGTYYNGENLYQQIFSLYEAGVLTGVDDYGAFFGSKTLTRAEAATMAARVLDPARRVKFTMKPLPTEGYTLTPMQGIDYDNWLAEGHELHASWFTMRSPYGAGIFWADGDRYVLSPYGRASGNELLAVLDSDHGRAVMNTQTRQLVFPWTKWPDVDLVTLKGEEHFTVTLAETGERVLYNAAGEPVDLPDGTDWDHIYGYSDGPVPAQDETTGLWGYRDTKGNWIIEPQWQNAYAFEDGYAVVSSGTHSGVIDRSGNEVISADAWGLAPLGEGLYLDSESGFGGTVLGVNVSERATPYISNDAQFQNGYAPLTLRSKYGYRDGGTYYVSDDLVPVSQLFDQAGPIGPDGAGFVVLDGVVYRIQFEWDTAQ